MKKIKWLCALSLLFLTSSPVLAEGNVKKSDHIFGSMEAYEPREITLDYPETYSPDNELIVALEELVSLNNTLGVNDEVTLVYTGNYIATEEHLEGVFLLINKTGKTLTDFNMMIDFSVHDEPILIDYLMEFRSADFMDIQDNTAIPLTLPFDLMYREHLDTIETYDSVYLETFDFEDLSENESEMVEEGSEVIEEETETIE